MLIVPHPNKVERAGLPQHGLGCRCYRRKGAVSRPIGGLERFQDAILPRRAVDVPSRSYINGYSGF